MTESLGDLNLFLLGLIIFCLRIVDVSLGTVRTIMIVQGRTLASFVLGFFEVLIWLSVISTVVHLVQERPALIFFYAMGFATGNFAGIKLEKFLASGHTVLRVFSQDKGDLLARRVRDRGFAATTFTGQGMAGPVVQVFVVCRRRDVGELVGMTRKIDPEAFYITERAGSVSKVIRPFMAPRTGWRAIAKKK